MKNPLTIAFLTTGLASSALADDVLINYQFHAGSAIATSSAIGIDASEFDIGPAGAGGSPAWIISGGTEMALGYANSTPASESDAVTNGSYFGFTLTPVEGNEVSLTTLTFDTIANATQGLSGSANVTFFVRSSVDNYTTTIDSLNQEYVNSFTFDQVDNRTVTLSGASYQDLTEATTFRIYIWDTSGSSLRTPRIDNVILNGTAAIPEPSSAVLPALALLGVLAYRRRRLK